MCLASILRDEISTRDSSRIDLHIGSDPYRLTGDVVGLRRVFGNLLDNALQYGQNVKINLSKSQEQQNVTIDDDGPGIPKAEHSTVFEPFFRLDQSRNRTSGGSGLGLAIVKQIIDAHGGTVCIGEV